MSGMIGVYPFKMIPDGQPIKGDHYVVMTFTSALGLCAYLQFYGYTHLRWLGDGNATVEDKQGFDHAVIARPGGTYELARKI